MNAIFIEKCETNIKSYWIFNILIWTERTFSHHVHVKSLSIEGYWNVTNPKPAGSNRSIRIASNETRSKYIGIKCDALKGEEPQNLIMLLWKQKHLVVDGKVYDHVIVTRARACVCMVLKIGPNEPQKWSHPSTFNFSRRFFFVCLLFIQISHALNLFINFVAIISSRHFVRPMLCIKCIYLLIRAELFAH